MSTSEETPTSGPRGTRFRAVLFDWDGTLLDSAETSYRCYVELFGSFGIPFDRGSFERTYSPEWRKTYSALGLPEQRWAEADARWLELYRRQRSSLLPGAREALLSLGAAGHRLGLVTSGDRSRIDEDMARFDLAGAFDVVVCGTDLQHRKPHPEGLLRALDAIGVAPALAAYVGDSPEDVAMARAAGAFTVGIPGGFPNCAALLEAKPDLVAESLAEAVAHITAQLM